jgi:hypothetical protein
MPGLHVPGSEWPARCSGSHGGVRVWESMETDPQAPPWRTVADWCLDSRPRRAVRLVAVTEILRVCPELAGRLW